MIVQIRFLTKKEILEIVDIFGLDNVYVNFINERSDPKGEIIYQSLTNIFSEGENRR